MCYSVRAVSKMNPGCRMGKETLLWTLYYTKSYRMTNTETHPSPGIRWHWPVIPAIRLLWTIMTPLGLPVEPLVYITTAISEGWGFTMALPTARQTNSYCFTLYVRGFSLLNLTKKHNQGESDKYALFSGSEPSSRTDCMLWMDSPAG